MDHYIQKHRALQTQQVFSNRSSLKNKHYTFFVNGSNSKKKRHIATLSSWGNMATLFWLTMTPCFPFRAPGLRCCDPSPYLESALSEIMAKELWSHFLEQTYGKKKC